MSGELFFARRIQPDSGCGSACFAFGWSRFGSFSAAGRDVGPVDPFWVFLAPGHFAAKTPADECWIVLDFLGFSRPNPDFSMGYEAFSGKNFSLSLSAGAETPEREPAVLACGRAGLFMGKLNLFSDFLQEITARAVPFRPPQSKSHSL